MGAYNPLALEQFARLADQRLDSVLENYLPQYQAMIETLFGSMPLDKAFAELFDIGSTPDIPAFTGKLDYLDIAPGYYTRIEPSEYAGGIQMQRKFRDDKQYGVLDDLQGGLVTSYGRTREKAGAKAFGYAFSTSWDYMSNEEGVSLCSGSHTTKSGTSTSSGFSNSGSTALSKTSVNATRILFKKFRNDISEIYASEPDCLIVPESLYDTANEIVGYVPESGSTEQKDPTTGQWRVSTTYKAFKVIPWRRLDEYSTTTWFMADSNMMKKFLIWIDRVKAETGTRIDWDTFAIQQKLYGRFGWGWRNWRFIYGHNV